MGLFSATLAAGGAVGLVLGGVLTSGAELAVVPLCERRVLAGGPDRRTRDPPGSPRQQESADRPGLVPPIWHTPRSGDPAAGSGGHRHRRARHRRSFAGDPQRRPHRPCRIRSRRCRCRHERASQLGSSIGAALLNTVAATAAVSYLTLHPTAGIVTGTVHGFTVAMVWGAALTLAAALPIAFFVNARTSARHH